MPNCKYVSLCTTYRAYTMGFLENVRDARLFKWDQTSRLPRRTIEIKKKINLILLYKAITDFKAFLLFICVLRIYGNK